MAKPPTSFRQLSRYPSQFSIASIDLEWRSIDPKKSALLSIKPRFANLLLSGEKKIELRKRAPCVEPGGLLVLYASSPTCAVVGALQVKEVVRTNPEALWEEYRQSTAVSPEEYWSYYGDSDVAEGVLVAQAIAFEQALSLHEIRSAWPGFMPPQSFRYIETRIDETKMRLALSSYPDQELVVS